MSSAFSSSLYQEHSLHLVMHILLPLETLMTTSWPDFSLKSNFHFHSLWPTSPRNACLKFNWELRLITCYSLIFIFIYFKTFKLHYVWPCTGAPVHFFSLFFFPSLLLGPYRNWVLLVMAYYVFPSLATDARIEFDPWPRPG